MKTYKYIFLDWDGCVAKTLDLWMEAYRQTFQEFGVDLPEKTIAQEVFGDWNGALKFGIKENDLFNKKVVEKVDETYPMVKLYDGAFKTIAKLKKDGKKLALLTSSRRDLVFPALKNNNISTYFDLLLTAGDVKKHKPDPEIINKALTTFNCGKDEVIIMGDSKSDLGAATNAGISSILFYPEENETFYDFEFLKSFNPSFIVRKFDGILDIIG